MQFKVKERRKELGLSQEELSEKAGVSRVIISRLENNDQVVTTTATLIAIADAMNCQVSDIFLR